MRTFVVLSLIATATVVGAQSSKAGQHTQPTQKAAAQSPELLPDEQVQQVLNRLTFGPRVGDAEKVRAVGTDAWIDQQLHPERIPDRAIDSVMSKFNVYAM